MTVDRGANNNVNDEAILTEGIVLNENTSVVIAESNDKRISFKVIIEGVAMETPSLWIKYQPASEDSSIQKGEWMGVVSMGTTMIAKMEVIMDHNIYTGEISAIGTGTIYVTEY